MKQELQQANDVERLRADRNVYKFYTTERKRRSSENRNAEYTEDNASAGIPSQPSAGLASSGQRGPSRKEDSKVMIPQWPKINDIGIWRQMRVVRAAIQASGDLDIDAWTR